MITGVSLPIISHGRGLLLNDKAESTACFMNVVRVQRFPYLSSEGAWGISDLLGT